MITLYACPLCGSDLITSYDKHGLAPRVSHEMMPGVYVNAVVIADYHRCLNCNLIFQNPRLSDDELEQFYSRGHYRKNLNLTEEEIDKDELFRARVDSGLIRQNIRKINSHLDVGCSRGYLLESVGAETKVGVEQNPDWVRAEGIKVYKDINSIPHRFFDLVTAIHVLEHASNPSEYLEGLMRFLSKNSYMIIEVPTWESPGGPLRLAHLHHFEPPVLRYLCTKAGLRIIQEKFTPHLMLICKRGIDK